MGEPLTLTPGIPTPVEGGRQDKLDKGGKLRNGPINKTQICDRKRRKETCRFSESHPHKHNMEQLN